MSGYLRDIQLRKQLEQKVKEATKNRQEAEKELAATTEILKDCKGIDADVTEAETALAEATSAMSAKDYKHGLEKAIEAKEKAKKAYVERATAIVESSAVLLDLAKKTGASVADGEAAIKKSREALAKEDYATALDLASKSWKKFEKIVHEHLSKQFTSAQSLIMAAKNLGKETGPVEDLLSRARSAVESNDFEAALGFTKECLEAIQSELVDEVAKETGETELLMKTAQELGLDVTRMSSLIERSRTDSEKLEFQKAINSLKQAKTEGEKTLQKGLDTKFSELENMMESATAMGADINKMKTLFENSMTALQEGKFQESANLAKQAIQDIQATQFQKVLMTIAQSRDKFVAARNIGADITPAVEILNKARQSLQKGNFREALDHANKALEMVDSSIDQFKQVEVLVKEMGTDFVEAESLGVATTSARRFLERAKKDLNAKDFAAALDQVRKAKEELTRSEYERTMEVMEQTEFVMTLGERMRADLEESGRLLEECIVATKEKQYRKAIELAQAASLGAEAAIKNQLTDALASLRGSLGFLAEDASSVRSLVEKAEGAMAGKDYDGAFTFVSEARKFVEGRTKSKAEDFRTTMKTAVKLGSTLGTPVGVVADMLKEVDEAYEGLDYSKMLKTKERSINDLGALGESVFNLVKDKLVEARNLKINIDDVLQVLKRARMALSIGDMSEAFRLMADTNNRITKLIAIYRETYNAISSAAALVAEAKKKEVDVTSVLEMLLEAKKAFERFDYERALELSKKAKAETESLMTLYQSAQSIVATKEKMETAASLGIATATFKDFMDQAKDAMKNKGYDEALNITSQTQQAIDEAIADKVNSIISQSETMLQTFKDISMSQQLEKLEKAKELAGKNEWVQAGELALAAREELERSAKVKEEATIAVKKCQDMISEAETYNIDTPDAKKILEKATRILKAGNFEDALAAADTCVVEFEKERDANVSKTIDRFQESIDKAKRDGIDTRSADKLLDKAREQFKQKKFRQALALAMQSEAESERIGLQQDMAAKAIMTAEKKLKSAESPVPESSTLLNEAQRSFEDGDYVKALDLAIRAGDSFNKYREIFDESQEIKSKAEKITATAYQIGAEADKLDLIIGEAHASLAAGEARSARDAYQQCIEWGLGICRNHLEKLRGQAIETVENLKPFGMDPTQFMKKLSESKAYIDSENFEAAFKLIEDTRKEAQELVVNKVQEALDASAETIELAKSLRADIGDAEDLLEDARKALESGNYQNALRLVNESASRVESRREPDKKFIEFSYKAESTIRNAKKFGIDVSEAEDVLKKALKIKKTNLKKGIELAKQACDLVDEAIEAFTPMMEISLDIPNAVLDQQVDGSITIANVGKVFAKDLKIKILGNAEVEGLTDIQSLRAKGEATIPLKVKMTEAGQVPLAIQVSSQRAMDGKEYQQEIVAQVEVSETAEAPKPLVATQEGRCGICKGMIKVGFKIITCPSCGQEFHETCGSRAGKCPYCNAKLL